MFACWCKCCNAPQRNFHSDVHQTAHQVLVAIVQSGPVRGSGDRSPDQGRLPRTPRSTALRGAWIAGRGGVKFCIGNAWWGQERLIFLGGIAILA